MLMLVMVGCDASDASDGSNANDDADDEDDDEDHAHQECHLAPCHDRQTINCLSTMACSMRLNKMQKLSGAIDM